MTYAMMLKPSETRSDTWTQAEMVYGTYRQVLLDIEDRYDVARETLIELRTEIASVIAFLQQEAATYGGEYADAAAPLFDLIREAEALQARI